MKQPELQDNFSDRGLVYDCLIMAQYAAMYQVTAPHDPDFICYDVFRFGSLKTVGEDSMALYPDDDAFIFDQEVDSYSGEMCMKDDLFFEAIIRFKTLGYLM